MAFLFTIARALRLIYKAVRAAVGIVLISHGVTRWAKNKRGTAAAR